MKNFWKTLSIILILTIPLVTLVFYIDSKQTDETNLENNQIQSEQFDYQETTTEPLQPDDFDPLCPSCTTTIEHEEINNTTIKQSAWIPPWDYKSGLQSLQNFESEFDSISPVVFQVNNDGTLTARIDAKLTDLKEITEAKNIKIIPTISNFSWTTIKEILNDQANTQRHISAIVQVVKNYEYDGIDLDYESIKLDDKEKFLSFLETLAQELQKDEKILSVTVLPKWGEGVAYTSLTETRNVQDWEKIGEYADQVRIMAYDFTPVSNSKEGPIAPIDWIDKILKYAKEKIPDEKIWLGIHLYSYEWVMPTTESEEIKVRTNSYTYSTVKTKVLSQSYVNVKYNEQYQEGYAEYSCLNNYFCILYYATPESVKIRQDLAKTYGIAGVTYWRLGGEADLIR